MNERFKASLLNLTRNIIESKLPNVQYQRLDFSSDVHHYETRHATEGRFKLPLVNGKIGISNVMYRAMVNWNVLPSDIVYANSKHQFKILLKRHLLV